MEKTPSISIHCFTDVLCVWAYVAQIRVDELCRTHGDNIALQHHFRPIFGDTQRKITAGWKDRGGFQAFGRHVAGVANRFEHVTVHPEVWSRSAPLSSIPAHLFLNTVRLVAEEGSDQFDATIWAVREAFFKDLRDVGQRGTQLQIAEAQGLDVARIEKLLDSGAAHAEMDQDMKLAERYDINVSPTLVFNEGRQRLVGNVGFRIIDANIRELLHRDDHAEEQLSWC